MVAIGSIRFEWDEGKNLTNQRKHHVSFEQAAQAFQDPSQISRKDRFENGEERWQTFGRVDQILLVMVAHTFHEGQDETVIRIISARRADRKERRIYEEENG